MEPKILDYILKYYFCGYRDLIRLFIDMSYLDSYNEFNVNIEGVSQMTCSIALGDCLEVLKELEDNSVDSLITDPPAGIAFMNKEWDKDKGGRDNWIKWMTSIMVEVKRVLKPGAHGFVWSLPRTNHWTATALENAGFEIRDCVTHLFGSGFPKSLNVSKAIDKMYGAEREVIAEVPHTTGIHRNHSLERDEWKKGNKHSKQGCLKDNLMKITRPSTPEAKQWDGFGTGLKPAYEHWILIRKPLSEKTVAKNVLKWGTGAINIDVSRVESIGKDINARKNKGNINSTCKGQVMATEDGTSWNASQGRFPANLVLSHSEDCEYVDNYNCVPDCAVRLLDEDSGQLSGGGPSSGRGFQDKYVGGKVTVDLPKQYIQKGGGASRFFKTFEPEGLRFKYTAKASKTERNSGLDISELIWESELWQKPDLNLLMESINQLSRDISDDTLMGNNKWNTDIYGHSISDQYPKGMTFTIETVIKLITELKTLNCSQNSNTRDCTLDAIRTIEGNGLSLAESVEFLSQLDLNTIKGATGYPLGVVHAALKMLKKIRDYAKTGNFHSTVKSQKLMEYLINMITPPGGTILDPFMGSGSTLVAATTLEFNGFGIEQNEEYFNIAKARITHAKKLAENTTTSERGK